MKRAQPKFRIGDIAKKVDVKEFVIRFWEKEFNIRAHRSTGGQRHYTSKDLETFLLIKGLLYEQGFTIAGAKKHITTVGMPSKKLTIAAAQLDVDIHSPIDRTTTTEQESPDHSYENNSPPLLERLAALKQQLLRLRDIL